MSRTNRHDRGMLLVVAIPMAAILVGCVWQLAGMSDALLFRENLEDAADSTAFHSAVLHARGMNAIASLNVIMGLLSAVTGLVRAVQVLGVLGADPLVTAADRADAALRSRIEESLQVAAEAQVGLATATPLLAASSAAAASASFYAAQPAGSRALAFSYALLPAGVDSTLDVDPARPWLLAPASDPRSSARLGTNSSLPVSRDLPDPLCAQGRAWSVPNVPALAPDVLRDPTLASRARSLASELHRALDRPLAHMLCGSSPPMAALCPEGDDLCAARLEAYAAAARPERPAQVWPRAENGNVVLQTWASAHGRAPRGQSMHERALEMLARGSVSLEPDRNAFAQSEYYFACPAGRRRWPECREHALWSLGWRARPRRHWRPDTAAPQLVGRAFERGMPALERALHQLGVRVDARAGLSALLSHEAP